MSEEVAVQPQEGQVIDGRTSVDLQGRKVFGHDNVELNEATPNALEDDSSFTDKQSDQDAPTNSFKFKGKEVGTDEVQKLLKQAEHLDRLRGDLGNRLGQKDKEIAALRESLAKLEGKVETSELFNPKSNEPGKGDQFQNMIIENPEEAYNMILQDAKEEIMKSLRPELDGIKTEVSSTVNNGNLVRSFYESYPDIKEYRDIKIGGKSIVDHAKTELLQRAQSDPDLSLQLNDTQTAFRLLAESTKELASRFSLKSSQPSQSSTAPQRAFTDNGSSPGPAPVRAVEPKKAITQADHRKNCSSALQFLRDRIKASNAAVLNND